MFENFSFEMDKENNEVMHTPHNTAYRLTQISFILNMVSSICVRLLDLNFFCNNWREYIYIYISFLNASVCLLSHFQVL